MKIQYLSDVHLEFRQEGKIQHLIDRLVSEPDPDILVICGDLTPNPNVRRKFLTQLGEQGEWKHIWVVGGNHDYWGWSRTDTFAIKEQQLMSLNDIDNVTVFNNTRLDLEGVTVLGTTLWSNPKQSDAQWSRDFQKIPEMTIEKYRQLHIQSKQWLEQELEQTSSTTICLSHHLPSFDLLTDSDCSTMYASDCDDLIKRVNYWFYGHSHVKMNKLLYGCRCLSNPYGYPMEKIHHHWTSEIIQI